MATQTYNGSSGDRYIQYTFTGIFGTPTMSE